MPLTVVFDDLKGYPEPETIITKTYSDELPIAM